MLSRNKLLYFIFESPQPVQAMGEGNGKWHLASNLLSPESIVYSAGVGQEISFEKQLVSEIGCTVQLFDPSPTGRATMQLPQNQDPRIEFQELGLAASDGDIVFSPPRNPCEGSFTIPSRTTGPVTRFACRSLPSLMNEKQNPRIDFLKMDIEGFEYPILTRICRDRIPVSQICVEFHHCIVPGVTRMTTFLAMLRLHLAGFRLIHHDGLNHTFLHKRDRRINPGMQNHAQIVQK